MSAPIFQIGSDGAELRVVGAIDTQSATYLGLAIFVAITAALLIYAKVK